MDQPGMVASPARSEMNGYEMLYFIVNKIKSKRGGRGCLALCRWAQ